MVRGTCRRSAWRHGGAAAFGAVVVAAGFALAACSTSGQLPLGVGSATVAFESIDGPPEPVFRKLVAQLNEEAGAHQVAVVSRDQSSQYRIRGYMAAHSQGKRATITWVWDVYTADHLRATRIAGEIPATMGERNAWAAADDQVIGRIARDGMDRLVTFLVAPPSPGDQPAIPPETPESSGPNVASAPIDSPALAYQAGPNRE